MDIGLPQDFKDFLRLLDAEGVEYLLIGGYAVAYHGYPRATEDIDLWIASNPENAERIVRALRQFGFDVPELAPDLFLKPNSIVRMGVPPLRIELATTISGLEFRECYKARLTEVLDGINVSIISLADLKENKKASGRFRDLDDLERLP
jgi:predicted nucleotidyltransferase